MTKFAILLSYKLWGGVGAIAAVISLYFVAVSDPGNSGDTSISDVKESSIIQKVEGSNITQNRTGNITIFQNNFGDSLNSKLADESEQKRILAKRIIDIINKTIVAADSSNLDEKSNSAKMLGEELGAVIQKAPISKYQLEGTEFTLRVGVAHFLPGGQNTLVYSGRATSGPPGPRILIKVNGKSKAMTTGDHYIIQDRLQAGVSECSLILHEITEDYKQVTFSYICQNATKIV